MLTQLPDTYFGVITVRQLPDSCSDKYEHSTASTVQLTNGMLNIMTCDEVGPCSKHNHTERNRWFITESKIN